jgi:translation initiation factor eIF-2B subunit delta
VVNLRYDLTPISNISVVATEIGLIPPTSIPVLIRELRGDIMGGDN